MAHEDDLILDAEVLAFREIHELPGDWAPEMLRSLLADLETETDDVPESDLLDLAMMAVGDLEPHEAGVAVLRTVFGDRMTAGVRSNLASDLQEDRPWEDFADLSFQAGIFSATVLLQKSLPKMFGIPDATLAEVALRTATAKDMKHVLKLPDDQLLRALAPGLGARSIVARLYEEGIRGGPFPEAEHILWRREMIEDTEDPQLVVLKIIGAHSFLSGLKDADPWQVEIDLT
jgi:hypothetical protein